jgi:hypothetical protein
MKACLVCLLASAIIHLVFAFLPQSPLRSSTQHVPGNYLDCVVLTETVFGTLRCFYAWDVTNSRTIRPLPTAKPTNNGELLWPVNSFKFGERLKICDIVLPDTLYPHKYEDIAGSIIRNNVPPMSSSDVSKMLETSSKFIANGGIDLGLPFRNYCEEGEACHSMFIVKLRTETSTSLDGVGSLILTSTECGLVNLRVTSVAQRLEGPRSYPPGSLVIVGLARGWNGGSSGYFNPKRCYLMVIGIISPESQDTTDGAEVVKLSRKGGVVVQDCDVYIGRRVARGGWNLPSSKWHNPFVAKDSNPESVQEAVNLYEKYVRKSPGLMDSIEELRGKRLGCWCKTSPGAPCHGDVLVKLLNEAEVENYV